MHYFLSAALATAGAVILFWNKGPSVKFGTLYSRRFSATFGKMAHFLGWDDPNAPFNKFMYRGFVVTVGTILLVFAFAALFGADFIGQPDQRTDPLLSRIAAPK